MFMNDPVEISVGDCRLLVLGTWNTALFELKDMYVCIAGNNIFNTSRALH